MRNFREWEMQSGRRQTVAGYARFLGVKQPTLNRWMTGDNIPTGEHLDRLAEKLGYEVYAIAGAEPPSPIIDCLHTIQDTYNGLPPDEQQVLVNRINKIIQDTMREFGAKRIK